MPKPRLTADRPPSSGTGAGGGLRRVVDRTATPFSTLSNRAPHHAAPEAAPHEGTRARIYCTRSHLRPAHALDSPFPRSFCDRHGTARHARRSRVAKGPTLAPNATTRAPACRPRGTRRRSARAEGRTPSPQTSTRPATGRAAGPTVPSTRCHALPRPSDAPRQAHLAHPPASARPAPTRRTSARWTTALRRTPYPSASCHAQRTPVSLGADRVARASAGRARDDPWLSPREHTIAVSFLRRGSREPSVLATTPAQWHFRMSHAVETPE